MTFYGLHGALIGHAVCPHDAWMQTLLTWVSLVHHADSTGLMHLRRVSLMH